MYKNKYGLLIGENTPTSLILAEVAHLDPIFDHENNGEKASFKLMINQVIDTVTVQNAHQCSQQSILNFTNNGIYAAQKGIYNNVVQIDTHSQLPTFMYYLGPMDEERKRMFLRKKEIERTPNYKDNPKLVKERADIKLQLNMYCSTNDTGKGRYINRSLAMYSSMNFIFECMRHWGFSTIVNCVNDGYITRTDPNEDFEGEFHRFEKYWQKQFPMLTLSKKYWKYAIIKSPQEYILINTPDDYKCRVEGLSVHGFYHQYTGKSLRKLKDDEVDRDVLQIAQRKEQEAMTVLYNHMFRNKLDDFSDSLEEIKRIIHEAGFPEIEFLPIKYHYYSFTLDTEHSASNDAYINDVTKMVFERQLFKTTEKLSTCDNLFGQRIEVEEVNPDDFEKANRLMVVNNFVPCVIDPIKKGQSLESWIKYEVEKIDRSEDNKLGQYNLLATIAQLYARVHGQDSNAVLKLINKLRTTNELKKLDMGERIANDPRVAIVNSQLLVKDTDHGTYTSNSSVVNHLLKSHYDQQQKKHFISEKNNDLALLDDADHQDQLEDGFMTPHQAILIDDEGNIINDSPFKHRLSHHVNVDFNPDIVNDPAYHLVQYFLKHLAPKQLPQLLGMLGLIPIQESNAMSEARPLFVLKGVSAAGKSTLAKLLTGIFDDEGQATSNVLSSTQNVNKAFTDEHYVDLNDSRKGKVMIWVDDFQSSGKVNSITMAAGTAINGVIGGVPQTAAAKYEKEHAVLLPKLIVIATNSMPLVTQEGTAKRMFVIDCPNTLKEDPIRDEQGRPISVGDFLSNTKVKEALFYIIMVEASKLLKMSNKQRAELFDRKHSAATKLNQLSDTFETFLEKKEITSAYDLVGMQAIKLFDVYKSAIDSYNVSYRSFNEQLERLGLVLKRKHFKSKNYQKVICARNDKLTQAKLNAMFNDLQVTPDCVEQWDSFAQKRKGTMRAWHHGYDQLKKKYPQSSEIFKAFNFSN